MEMSSVWQSEGAGMSVMSRLNEKRGNGYWMDRAENAIVRRLLLKCDECHNDLADYTDKEGVLWYRCSKFPRCLFEGRADEID